MVLMILRKPRCRLSMALVRALRHWLCGRRVKVKTRSLAASRLSATARCLNLHLRMKALRCALIGGAYGSAGLTHQAAVEIEPKNVRFRFNRRVRHDCP